MARLVSIITIVIILLVGNTYGQIYRLCDNTKTPRCIAIDDDGNANNNYIEYPSCFIINNNV